MVTAIMPKKWKEYNRLSSKKISELNELNDLSGSQWAQMSKSVQKFNGAIAEKRRCHGAAYPITLAKHFIEIFTKRGDTVLDPFLGVGTTLDAAQLLGRNGVGFEINENFVRFAELGIDDIDRTEIDIEGHTTQRVIHDDCLNIKDYVKDNSIDFILTSPPYCNLLNNTIGTFGGSTYRNNVYNNSRRKIADPYSDNPQDFGNLSLSEFFICISNTMDILYDVAKEGVYNVWVVRDYRDMPNKMPYVNLHGKIAEIGAKSGWVLTDLIVWDQTNQRHLVKLGGKKSRRFYFNLGHSYIVVLRKNIEGEMFING